MFGPSEEELKNFKWEIIDHLRVDITYERQQSRRIEDRLQDQISALRQQLDELSKYLGVKLELNTEKPSPYKVVPR